MIRGGSNSNFPDAQPANPSNKAPDFDDLLAAFDIPDVPSNHRSDMHIGINHNLNSSSYQILQQHLRPEGAHNNSKSSSTSFNETLAKFAYKIGRVSTNIPSISQESSKLATNSLLAKLLDHDVSKELGGSGVAIRGQGCISPIAFMDSTDNFSTSQSKTSPPSLISSRSNFDKLHVVTASSPVNSPMISAAAALVSSLTGSCPPSLTLSMAEILSDDMIYQLSTNVLPPYVPSLFSMSTFSKGHTSMVPEHKCVDCGDCFVFESSLSQHLQRRSVYITFNCDHCLKHLVYYNRCNLLSHIRQHRQSHESADIRKAVVSPLPRELINSVLLQPHHPPPLVAANISNVTSSVASSNYSSVGLLITAPAANKIVSPPTPVLVESNVVRNGNEQRQEKVDVSTSGSPTAVPASSSHVHTSTAVTSANQANKSSPHKCSECSQSFDSANGLEEHFGRSQNMPLATSQCGKCQMTCPSKCGLSAHHRIHLQSKPFVCPECGMNVSDVWEVFQRHLSVNCLHYSRAIGYKCGVCSQLYVSGETVRQHIIGAHGEAYYKCQSCPMAFKSAQAFDSHKRTAHLTLDVQVKTIFKCPLCDTVFHGDKELHDHLDVHIKEQIMATRFVFKCLECHLLVETKSALAAHMQTMHQQLINKEVCLECGALFDAIDQLSAHRRDIHSPKETTTVGSGGLTPDTDESGSPGNKLSPTTLTALATSLLISKVDRKADGGGGNNASATKESKTAKDNKSESAGLGPTKCGQCDRAFQTNHGYNIHRQKCHGTALAMAAQLQCFVCGQTFSNKKDVSQHGVTHLQEGLLVCTLCNNPLYESRSGLSKHLEAHATQLSYPSRCDRCDIQLGDQTTASAHFKSDHDLLSYTCHKCGAVFDSSRLLSKHMQTTHGEEKGGGAASSNRIRYPCWLCRDRIVFKKRSLLDKHLMMTHRMTNEQVVALDEKTSESAALASEQKTKTDVRSSQPPDVENRKNEGMAIDQRPFEFENISDDEPRAKRPCMPLSNAQISDNANGQQPLFSCAKCHAFSSNDKAEFARHILNYRTEKTAQQCPQCGLCFVVEPSLRRHLKAVHRVNDLDKYFIEEGLSSDSEMSTDSSNYGVQDGGDGLKCVICAECFDTSARLKIHARSHGMAFIRSRSAIIKNEQVVASGGILHN